MLGIEGKVREPFDRSGPTGPGLPAPAPGGDTQNPSLPMGTVTGTETGNISSFKSPAPLGVTNAPSPTPTPAPQLARSRPHLPAAPDPLTSLPPPQINPESSTERSTFARTGEERFRPFQGHVFGQGANQGLRDAYRNASSGALGRSVGAALQGGDLSRALIGGGGGGGQTAGDLMGVPKDQLDSQLLQQLGLGGQ